jgi:VanZ family protein
MNFKHPTVWLESKPTVAWTLAIAYAFFIFIMSSFPYGPPQPSFLKAVSSTFKHVLEYLVFGFLLLACFRSNHKTKRFALFLAFLVASFYGLTDELHQLFVQGRTASIVDFIADSSGGFFGALVSLPRLPWIVS